MKQEMKSKRSKDQIIQAALSLFSNKGYKETTMADLVTVTGLSKGLFTITSKVKKRFYNS
ncbi:TetR/AcrR family transcriptional regulator [Streptococcus sp. 2A/TPW/M5]